MEHGFEATNPVESPRKGAVTPKKRLVPFNKYLKTMTALPQLSNMAEERRENLLRDFYLDAAVKHHFEEWAETERSEALELRKWSEFLNRAQPRIREALNQLSEIASFVPKPSEIELLFDTEEFRLGIVKIAKRLVQSSKLASRLQSNVAALINPRLRSTAEQRSVQQELLARYDFSLSAKSSELDHWLVDAAAIRLDRYRDHHGKKIPRYDRVISALFKAVFDQIMTDENVRTTLRRLRAQNSGTDQGREPVGTNSTSSPVPEPQNVRTNRSK